MDAFRRALASAALPWLVLLGASGSCRYFDAGPRPLSDSTLVDVLAGLHVAASRAETYGEPTWDWRDSVLAAHGVDSVQLRITLLEHADRPEEFIHLYSAVLDRLNELWNADGRSPSESPYQGMPPPPGTPPDSAF